MGKLNYLKPVLYSSHEIKLTSIPELWGCHKCESWFTNNVIPEKDAARLYKTGVSKDRWLQDPFEVGKPDEVNKFLSEVFTEGKKVLDVGCNTGELLDFAKKKGSETSGVEYSPASRDFLKEKGHQYFSSLDEVNDRYDVITLFDLIEHIYNPSTFLDVCKNVLKDGGILLILTGNIHGLNARLCKSKWWYVNFPEHIVFPSKKYFQNIKGLKFQRQISTYASLAFKHPVPSVIRCLIRDFYRRRYTGLPSIGPDHVLLSLSKQS